MWRDGWFKVGVLGSILACVACLTPIAAVVLGAIGLGAWTGRLDVVLMPALALFVLLAVYRYRRTRGGNDVGGSDAARGTDDA